MENIHYKTNQSDFNDIYYHLMECDLFFNPKLSEKIDIVEYSKKINAKAIRVEAWNNDLLIGLVAYYFNPENSTAFITNVSVLDSFKGLGIAKKLLQEAINQIEFINCISIQLEVGKSSFAAINLYLKFDFEIAGDNLDNYLMKKIIK